MKFMETTPRKTKLYNLLAKDYTPKKAEMQICQYIEKLEQRIVVLEEELLKKAKAKVVKKTEPVEQAEN